MPTSSGPNIQHGSNLVFDYDTGDVVNSYIGEPTTNLASGLGLTGMSGISLSYLGLDNGWKKYSMSGTWSGGGYPYCMYLDAVTFTGGQYYSSQALIKTNVSGKFNYFGDQGISYVNQPKDAEGTLVSTVQYDGSIYVARYGFAYTSTTGQTGYLFTNPKSGITFDPNTDFVWLKNFQIEQKNHCTPYTPTSRSNTQGLLDVSGRANTVNLSSVSFDSAAQPYFDGTDDSLVISNSDALKNNNTSIEFIIMYTNTPNGDIVQFGVGSGAYAQYYYRAYSGNSYWVWYPPNSSRYSEITIPNSAFTLNRYHHVVMTGDSTGNCNFYINGVVQPGVSTIVYSTPSSWTPANLTVGGFSWDGYSSSKIPLLRIYNTVLTTTQIQQNYNSLKQRFNLPNVPYIYSEGANANLYTANWNNSTTYTMADFGGLPNVTAHGFSSGPVTYTLTLNALPPHTRVRYKVFWHLVDSLDNETNQLFLSTSSGESEILRFTKVYNSAPNISVAASPGTYTWSGPKTYTYRPWANGYYNQDGYIIVDSGYISHTASTFTARHVMGADQAQADEAEYLSHVEVEISG